MSSQVESKNLEGVRPHLSVCAAGFVGSGILFGYLIYYGIAVKTVSSKFLLDIINNCCQYIYYEYHDEYPPKCREVLGDRIQNYSIPYIRGLCKGQKDREDEGNTFFFIAGLTLVMMVTFLAIGILTLRRHYLKDKEIKLPLLEAKAPTELEAHQAL